MTRFKRWCLWTSWVLPPFQQTPHPHTQMLWLASPVSPEWTGPLTERSASGSLWQGWEGSGFGRERGKLERDRWGRRSAVVMAPARCQAPGCTTSCLLHSGQVGGCHPLHLRDQPIQAPKWRVHSHTARSRRARILALACLMPKSCSLQRACPQ